MADFCKSGFDPTEPETTVSIEVYYLKTNFRVIILDMPRLLICVNECSVLCKRKISVVKDMQLSLTSHINNQFQGMGSRWRRERSNIKVP